MLSINIIFIQVVQSIYLKNVASMLHCYIVYIEHISNKLFTHLQRMSF